MLHSVRVGVIALSVLVAGPSFAGGVREGRVVLVDDGDTIDVRVGDRLERVRYIGLDAPEIGHRGVGPAPGGLAAARMNAALLGNGRVRLELDAQERDSYGRLLAYVWVGDRMINAELLRRGYARTLRIPPNLRYAALFAALEREARWARRGLWAGRAHPSAAIAHRFDCACRGAPVSYGQALWRSRAVSVWRPNTVEKKGSSSSPASRRWSGSRSISTAPTRAAASTPPL
jgi:micrococcal nuclease